MGNLLSSVGRGSADAESDRPTSGMIGLTAKGVFGAWLVVLAVLGGALALDVAAVWRYRHRRILTLVLEAVGVAVTAAWVMFTGLLVAVTTIR